MDLCQRYRVRYVRVRIVSISMISLIFTSFFRGVCMECVYIVLRGTE